MNNISVGRLRQAGATAESLAAVLHISKRRAGLFLAGKRGLPTNLVNAALGAYGVHSDEVDNEGWRLLLAENLDLTPVVAEIDGVLWQIRWRLPYSERTDLRGFRRDGRPIFEKTELHYAKIGIEARAAIAENLLLNRT